MTFALVVNGCMLHFQTALVGFSIVAVLASMEILLASANN